jgi:hypothetical protein
MRAFRRSASAEFAASQPTGGGIVTRPIRSWLISLFAGSGRRDARTAEAQPATDRALPRRYAGWAWRDETERTVMNDLGENKMFKVE